MRIRVIFSPRFEHPTVSFVGENELFDLAAMSHSNFDQFFAGKVFVNEIGKAGDFQISRKVGFIFGRRVNVDEIFEIVELLTEKARLAIVAAFKQKFYQVAANFEKFFFAAWNINVTEL